MGLVATMRFCRPQIRHWWVYLPSSDAWFSRQRILIHVLIHDKYPHLPVIFAIHEILVCIGNNKPSQTTELNKIKIGNIFLQAELMVISCVNMIHSLSIIAINLLGAMMIDHFLRIFTAIYFMAFSAISCHSNTVATKRCEGAKVI